MQAQATTESSPTSIKRPGADAQPEREREREREKRERERGKKRYVLFVCELDAASQRPTNTQHFKMYIYIYLYIQYIYIDRYFSFWKR